MTYQYVDAFLKLNCATDILNVVNPITKASKEISEVYAMVRALRKIIHPSDSHKYRVMDMCAGNGLLGVTVAHLFNYKYVRSWDIKPPKRKFDIVRKYEYLKADIHEMFQRDFEGRVILANHPCQRAKVVVDYFCRFHAKALVLMPCCGGQLSKKRSQYVINKFGKYGTWCMDLHDFIWDYGIKYGESFDINMYEDFNCLSPKNIIITAIRK